MMDRFKVFLSGFLAISIGCSVIVIASSILLKRADCFTEASGFFLEIGLFLSVLVGAFVGFVSCLILNLKLRYRVAICVAVFLGLISFFRPILSFRNILSIESVAWILFVILAFLWVTNSRPTMVRMAKRIASSFALILAIIVIVVMRSPPKVDCEELFKAEFLRDTRTVEIEVLNIEYTRSESFFNGDHSTSGSAIIIKPQEYLARIVKNRCYVRMSEEDKIRACGVRYAGEKFVAIKSTCHERLVIIVDLEKNYIYLQSSQS